MPKLPHRPESSMPRTNLFLARLDPEDYEALILEAKIVRLKYRQRLIRQDERVAAVYFPLTCMLSVLVTANDKPQM
jgi:hypothetical protein